MSVPAWKGILCLPDRALGGPSLWPCLCASCCYAGLFDWSMQHQSPDGTPKQVTQEDQKWCAVDPFLSVSLPLVDFSKPHQTIDNFRTAKQRHATSLLKELHDHCIDWFYCHTCQNHSPSIKINTDVFASLQLPSALSQLFLNWHAGFRKLWHNTLWTMCSA